MPMEGASQPRYTWYLAHTPTATPTKVPIGPLKPPSPPPLVWRPAGSFGHRLTRMKDVIVDGVSSAPPLSECYVYVLSSAFSLFCRVDVGRALLSEPHICVNSVCTFEVPSPRRPLLIPAQLWFPILLEETGYSTNKSTCPRPGPTKEGDALLYLQS